MRKTTELVECFQSYYKNYLLEAIWDDLLDSLKIAIMNFDFKRYSFDIGKINIVYTITSQNCFILSRSNYAIFDNLENEKITIDSTPFQRYVDTEMLEKFKSLVIKDDYLDLDQIDDESFSVSFSTNPDKYPKPNND